MILFTLESEKDKIKIINSSKNYSKSNELNNNKLNITEGVLQKYKSDIILKYETGTKTPMHSIYINICNANRLQ